MVEGVPRTGDLPAVIPNAWVALLMAAVSACGGRTALLPREEGAEASPATDGGQAIPDSGSPTFDAPGLFEGSADGPTPPPGDDAALDAAVTTTPPPDFIWYRLDETSGTTAHDSSGNHYDMTNLTGVVWGAGATFDGTSVCGSTTVGQASRTAPITMTVWLAADPRDDETTTGYALTPFPPNAFCGDSPSLGGFGIGLNVWTDGMPGNGLALETGVNQSVAFDTLAGVQAGVEYFVALVVGPTSADIYMNASVWATVTANTPATVTPAPLHLGCTNDDTGYLTKRFFKGRIRDARMYTRLLGAPEIAQLFANGPV